MCRPVDETPPPIKPGVETSLGAGAPRCSMSDVLSPWTSRASSSVVSCDAGERLTAGALATRDRAVARVGAGGAGETGGGITPNVVAGQYPRAQHRAVLAPQPCDRGLHIVERRSVIRHEGDACARRVQEPFDASRSRRGAITASAVWSATTAREKINPRPIAPRRSSLTVSSGVFGARQSGARRHVDRPCERASPHRSRGSSTPRGRSA